MTYDFALPIYIHVGSKKISLNLNWYRNAHYYELNATKQSYHPTEPDTAIFKAKKISVAYTLVWNNNRRTDFMNWIAIADKYFMDWLVTWEYMPDDSAKEYAAMSASVKIDTSVKASYIQAAVTVIE